MADTFRIYKGKEKVLEESSLPTITGPIASTDVREGTYQAVHVRDGKESVKADIPTPRTTTQ